MLKSTLSGITSGSVVLRGFPDAHHRLFVIASQHGQEIAAPEAIASLLEEEWQWPNVRACFAFDDMEGYREEGYGFISTEGEESSWPPLWHYHQGQGKGYWMWYDRNSSWGTTHHERLPRSLQGLRAVVDLFVPTFCLSLHETVHSEVELNSFWMGAGPLLIEEWVLSAQEEARLGGKSADVLVEAAALLATWVWPGFKSKYLQWILRNNSHYQTVTDVVNRYRDMGHGLTGKKWMEYLRYGGRNIIIGQGRVLSDPRMKIGEWRTVAGYMAAGFGCPSVTIETFPTGQVGMRGLDERVQQQRDFVRATLDMLNAQQWKEEYEGDWGEADKRMEESRKLESLSLAERKRLRHGKWGGYA